ncbi:hypothetical protein [Desulfocicer niacini]
MTCLGKQIAGNEMERSEICIGNLWIFKTFVLEDIQALKEAGKILIEGRQLILPSLEIA